MENVVFEFFPCDTSVTPSTLGSRICGYEYGHIEVRVPGALRNALRRHVNHQHRGSLPRRAARTRRLTCLRCASRCPPAECPDLLKDLLTPCHTGKSTVCSQAHKGLLAFQPIAGTQHGVRCEAPTTLQKNNFGHREHVDAW